MNVVNVPMLIEDAEIGEPFNYNDDIYIKTNASNPLSGFQCVELYYGNLVYIKKGTEITKVDAAVRVYT